jgi:hypothetical protein
MNSCQVALPLLRHCAADARSRTLLTKSSLSTPRAGDGMAAEDLNGADPQAQTRQRSESGPAAVSNLLATAEELLRVSARVNE